MESVLLSALGVVLIVVGGALAIHVQRRLRASLILSGQIVAVHEESSNNGASFRPVIRYIDANGNAQKMLSDAATSSIAKIDVGKPVQVVVDPNDVVKPATVGTLKVFGYIGFGLSIVGVGLGYYGVRAITFDTSTLASALFVGLILAFVATKAWQLLRTAFDPALLSASRLAQREQDAAAIEVAQELTTVDVNAIVSNETSRNSELKAKASRIMNPLRIVVGAVILIFAGPWSYQQLDLAVRGTAASGRVVSNEYSETWNQSDGHTYRGYHAIIQFQTNHGEYKVRDWFGLRSPQFHVGEDVAILYDIDHPERAAVNRGLWNVLPGLLVFLFGGWFVIGALWNLRNP